MSSSESSDDDDGGGKPRRRPPPFLCSSPFPPSLASCGVNVLSDEMDQTIMSYYKSPALAAMMPLAKRVDNLLHVAKVFWFLQQDPLFVDHLSNALQRQQQQQPQETTSIITTLPVTAAPGPIRIEIQAELRSFLLYPPAKSLFLDFLQKKRREQQQQQQKQTEYGSSNYNHTFVEPHAEAFAFFCVFLGLELSPALDDIRPIEGREEKKEEQGRERLRPPAVSSSTDSDEGVMAKAGKAAAASPMEIDEEEEEVEEEEEATDNRNAAPSTAAAQERKKCNQTFTIPTSLRGVRFLSQPMHDWFIQALGHDEACTLRTRYDYVSQLGVLFRALQDDRRVSYLLLSLRASDTRDDVNGVEGGTPLCLEYQREREFRRFSTVQDLRALFLQPVMKIFLVEWKRNAMATNDGKQRALMHRVLSLLELRLTVDGNDVVPKEVGATEIVERIKLTIPTSLRGVHFLSQTMHDWFIQAIGYGETSTLQTRYEYVCQLRLLFRALQDDPNVSELLLLPPGASDMRNDVNGVVGEGPHEEQEHQKERKFRQFSTVDELRTLFLHPVVRALLVERKRNAMATNKASRSALINRVLSLLELNTTADGNGVVPKEADATERDRAYTIPTSLRGVQFLSQSMHHLFLEAIGHDEAISLRNRYGYVCKLAVLFRALQDDPRVSELLQLPPEAADTCNDVERVAREVPPCLQHQREKKFRQFSTVEELRGLFLQPIMKAALVKRKRYAITKNRRIYSAVINRVLSLLHLSMTADGNDVVPKEIVERKKKRYTIPKSLRGVHLLSQSMNHWFIRALGHDQAFAQQARYRYVTHVELLFRTLQADSQVSELLLHPPEATDTRDNVDGVAGEASQCVKHQEEQRFRQFSTVEELRTLFLQPLMKTFLVERKRNALATKKWDQSSLINRLLSLLDLSMTEDGKDVVPKEAGALIWNPNRGRNELATMVRVAGGHTRRTLDAVEQSHIQRQTEREIKTEEKELKTGKEGGSEKKGNEKEREEGRAQEQEKGGEKQVEVGTEAENEGGKEAKMAIEMEAEEEMEMEMETEGTLTLPPHLQQLHDVLTEYRRSLHLTRSEEEILQEGMCLVCARDEHVERFMKELIGDSGDDTPPLIDLRTRAQREELAEWYLNLVEEDVFVERMTTTPQG